MGGRDLGRVEERWGGGGKIGRGGKSLTKIYAAYFSLLPCLGQGVVGEQWSKRP